MKSILFAIMVSMALAFSPAALPQSKASTTTLNDAAEGIAAGGPALLQVAGWIGAYAIGGAKLGGMTAGKLGPVSRAASSSAPAAAPAAAFDGDISIPYDAAAKNAYLAAGSPGSYEDFKAKYEADAVAEVKAKQKK